MRVLTRKEELAIRGGGADPIGSPDRVLEENCLEEGPWDADEHPWDAD